jgi:hypothetical protein
MQFRKLKRLANALSVDVQEPIFSFGEWQVPYSAFEGLSFNGQFTGSAVYIDDYDAKLTKSKVLDQAWDQIKYDAEEISGDECN